MAIRRRIDKGIRVVSVTSDDALDRTRTPISDYLETRKEDLVASIEGQKVTWFTLEPLDGESAAMVKTHLSPHRQFVAFQLGCSHCSEHELLEWREEGRQRRRMVSDAAMNRLPDRLWQELGSLVLQLGDLTEGEEPRFGL